MEREQLLAALSQRVDRVFLPRPLYLVESLPRNATGKLARDELAKLARDELAKLARNVLAKLTRSEPVQLARNCAASGLTQPVVVNRSVDPAHPALPGHFPGDPIVPGAVLLDEILDALTCELGACADFAGVTILSAKFLRRVRPGDSLQFKLIPGEESAVRFVCSVASETVVNGALKFVKSADQ